MLVKTQGIVLKSVHYSESSLIVQIFTQQLGMQSYIVKGAKKPKAKISQALLQPLFILDMVVYHKPNGGIQYISEAKQSSFCPQIYNNVAKQSLAFFLNEIIYKSIAKHDKDEPIFEFLKTSIQYLELCPSDKVANFHLQFLAKFSKLLGFRADVSNLDQLPFFDLEQGVACAIIPPHNNIILSPETFIWKTIFDTSFEQSLDITISPVQRKSLLSSMLQFYQLHLDNFGKIKSLEVFEEIFS